MAGSKQNTTSDIRQENKSKADVTEIGCEGVNSIAIVLNEVKFRVHMMTLMEL
jgi:predicted transport protein